MKYVEKQLIIRLAVAAVLFGAGFFTEGAIRLILFAASALAAGADVIFEALKNLVKLRALDENVLMTVAAVGAFALGDYPEGAVILIFYQIGEAFSEAANEKTRDDILALMDLRPDHATVVREGKAVEIDPRDAHVGETMLIAAGERVPLDGRISRGSSALDCSALTGEAAPVDVCVGSALMSGCVNLSAPIEAVITSSPEQSTAQKIVELAKNAHEQKAAPVKFITKFARVYTPAVVGVAVLLCAVPVIFFGEPFAEWLPRALTFLVVSCPCALVLSVPLAYFAGIGGAAKNKVLIKSGSVFKPLADVSTVVVDKTGTLTQAGFELAGEPSEELVQTAACALRDSDHPLAVAVCSRAKDILTPEQFSQTAGKGVRAIAGGREIIAGSRAWLAENGIDAPEAEVAGSTVYVGRDGAYLGVLELRAPVKVEAAAGLKRLRDAGVRHIVMLTGDNKNAADAVAAELGIDETHSGLLPAQKSELVREIASRGEGAVMFAGDGVNDAVALASADVGVAMGALGSDSAVELADVVLMTDNLEKLAPAILTARRTRAIAVCNIVFALAVKAAVLGLGAAGIVDMWGAVFADVGVSVLCVLNSLRALRPAK